ncbi:hypothetical protein GOBAR_AA32125 [Gossypium barbadense]|uniref:Uncharacterized protein n=1 Tax=Gossypium barbadense TaxID=3634 RepID=A0A2P5WBU8_GOSBA|nr:hypothetical protein GOBAR_AA32125 [Gossypium barbadense]
MKEKDGVDWSVEHQCYIALWNTQYKRQPEMHSLSNHDYRHGSQPMMELDLEDEHMAEPDSDTWVNAFCESDLSSNISNAGGCTSHVDASLNTGNSLPQIHSSVYTSLIYYSTLKVKVVHAATRCAHGYHSVWNLSHSHRLFRKSTP